MSDRSPVTNKKFDSYVSDHDKDEFAHGAAFEPRDKRLNALEKWRWFITGGVTMLAFVITVMAAVVAGNYAIIHSH